MYQYLAKKLNHFRMRYQRKLLKIKWHDKIPDTDVLAQANLSGKGQPVSDMFVTVIQNRALCHKNIRTLWKPKQDSQTTSRQSDNRQWLWSLFHEGWTTQNQFWMANTL